MRHPAKFLALLILSGTLMAQSKTGGPKPLFFPSQIKHVVVIIQENRTPDNIFHFLSPLCTIPQGASGLAACTPNPVTTSCYDISPCGLSNKSGKVLPVALTGINLNGKFDPNHAHFAFEQMCDPDAANEHACRNDGAWAISKGSRPGPYGYVQNPAVTNYDGSQGHVLDPYLTFAEQYGWANYMFQTNQGPSYPAHQFLFSGTSARSTAEDTASTFISDNPSPETSVGCLAPANATASLLSPLLGTLGNECIAFDANSVQQCEANNTALKFPTNPVGSFCADKPNMGGALDLQDISWKYYAPSAGDIWTAPNSIKDICVPQFKSKKSHQLVCTGTEWNAKVDLNFKGADVLNDITNCNLPSVSWVIPNGTWSDHAGTTDVYGPSWVAAIINSIGQNPTCASGADAGQTFWENTAIVVTWDDWGGWSDNQPPPLKSALPCVSDNCQGDYQYGFRVPLVVVSAYTPKGYISNNTYDFGSVLRMIEGVYGIPQGDLGFADARSSTDLSDFFQAPFRPYTPVPALEPPSYFLGGRAQKGRPVAPDND
jgi:phospholipase C